MYRQIFIYKSDDRWADPKGEYLSAFHAGEVYRLYGYDGLPSEEMPATAHQRNKGIGFLVVLDRITFVERWFFAPGHNKRSSYHLITASF